LETTKQEEERRKKPKPEEREGMPQHQHCPPAKRREDKGLIDIVLVHLPVERAAVVGIIDRCIPRYVNDRSIVFCV
jgi:hypothetical protein